MIVSKVLLPFLFVLAPQTGEGWLGVYLQQTEHPAISEVIPGTPADKAGLRAGDRVLRVGDVTTPTREAFVSAIRGTRPNQEIELRIRRGDREIDVEVRLAARPADADLPGEVVTTPSEEQPPRPAQEPAPPGRAFLGLRLRQEPAGVFVAGVVEDGPSDDAGVRAGERLTRCGDRRVQALADIERVLEARSPGDKVELTLRSDRGTRSVLVELGVAPDSVPPPEDPARVAPEAVDPGESAEESSSKPPQPEPAATGEGVRFAEDLAAARRVAEAEGKPILLVFGASWDSASRAQRKALADPSLAGLLRGVVPVWLDTDRHGERAERLSVQELPHLRLLRKDETVWQHEGYLPPAELAGALQEHAAAGDAAATGTGAGLGAADPEVEAALERVARRLERVEERLRRLENAAQRLEGLDELRQELEAVRKLLRDLSK